MGAYEKTVLGKTGVAVCRLGVACSYGAPTEAFEEAWEHGVNYFYWGSRRTGAMGRAIRNIIARGGRDKLVIVVQSYSRSAALMESFFHKALRRLGIDTADVLLLGWHNQPPSPRIRDRAEAMREKGMYRYLALSGHNRDLFPSLAADDRFDIFHVRYNAVHRGAESEVFARLPSPNRPGLVSYTATRWGDLLRSDKMPTGEAPLRAADCYRFVLSRPEIDVCITGPRNREEMRQALTAIEAGPMSEPEMERARRIGDHLHIHHRRLFS